jgi:hypothetical protein
LVATARRGAEPSRFTRLIELSNDPNEPEVSAGSNSPVRPKCNTAKRIDTNPLIIPNIQAGEDVARVLNDIFETNEILVIADSEYSR